VNERPYLSIGEVLGLLLEEFPDVTISKIRFLESQGLIEPERTPSGYRKFYDDDVVRLRFILREQREHYLPLKVIRDRLEDGDAPATATEPLATPAVPRGVRNVTTTAAQSDHTAQPDPTAHPSARMAAAVTRPEPEPAPMTPGTIARDVTDALERPQLMARDEVIALTGVDSDTLDQLEQFGLITVRRVAQQPRYDMAACDIAELAARFARLGIEVRHLRAWRVSVDREVGLFEQRVLPLLSQRNPRAKAEVASLLDDLVALSERLHSALVGDAVRAMVEGR
jgi:DNA-binding transcriptional MerR regulator